jgi:hypothetical protein
MFQRALNLGPISHVDVLKDFGLAVFKWTSLTRCSSDLSAASG